MSDPLGRAKSGYELVIKLMFPILLGVCSWTFAQLWSHEGRLTILETRNEAILDDVREIKADVKTLLGGR